MKKGVKKALFILAFLVINCVLLYLYERWLFIGYVIVELLIFYTLSNLFLLQAPNNGLPTRLLMATEKELPTIRGYKSIIYNIFLLIFFIFLGYCVITFSYNTTFSWISLLLNAPAGLVAGVSLSRALRNAKNTQTSGISDFSQFQTRNLNL
jgi:hypothetical protein